MCADFAIHDKGTGNPHVHIMLTLRPLKGKWTVGRKVPQRHTIWMRMDSVSRMGKAAGKITERIRPTGTIKGNVEFRGRVGGLRNRSLESAGRPERIYHRRLQSWQGIDKIPSVHLGTAVSQMEKRGIRTDKGR